MEFYPLDVTHEDSATRSTFIVYGVTDERKKVIMYDRKYKPYFFVIAENPEEFANRLEQAFPCDTEIVQMNFLGVELKVVRVSFAKIGDLEKIKEIAKKIPGYVDRKEVDLSFDRKYWIDKGITPLQKIRVEGKLIEEKEDMYVIEAERVVVLDEMLKPKILSFDIEAMNPSGIPNPERDPIVMISIYTKGLRKAITWKGRPTDEIIVVNNEKEMIIKFLELIKEIDPDIIVGYNTDNFDFPYLRERAKHYGLKLRIGEEIRISGRGAKKVKIVGKTHVDMYNFVRNALAPSLQAETYDLDTVSKEILGVGKEELSWEEFIRDWKAEKIQRIAKYCIKDAMLAYLLFEKFLPLMFELVKLLNQTLHYVSRMTYGQMVEWYLIKNAHPRYLIPDRPLPQEVAERKKHTYVGAYVHEPTPGLYKEVVVFDFRSLYPSIIASHNICPTTVDKECKEREYTPSGKHWICKETKGFIPDVIEDLIVRRARIKKMLRELPKDDPDYKLLEARSWALKTIANATYGYLGFPRSRWYCLACAETITEFGRYYINKVIENAKKEGFFVIYGDTDSVMIALNGKRHEDALEFMEKVNSELPGLMELELQGFYKKAIFVSKKEEKRGAKKRYVLLTYDDKLVIKGFEYVRRDWAEIAKEAQLEVLKRILIENDFDDALRYIRELISKVKKFEIPVEKMVILTQATKTAEEYESLTPHVAAALRYYGVVLPGTLIRYVVCEGAGRISEKTRLYEEVVEKGLKYDPSYYINNQILPAVESIFKVFGYGKEELLSGAQKKLTEWWKDGKMDRSGENS